MAYESTASDPVSDGCVSDVQYSIEPTTVVTVWAQRMERADAAPLANPAPSGGGSSSTDGSA